MSVADNATLPDHWPTLRQPRFALRRNRILPGPLKSLERRGRKPVWIACLGLVGLSLAATLAVAPHVRTGASTVPEPDPVLAAEPVPEAAEPVRIVGAAPLPPQAARLPETPVAVDMRPQAPIAISPAEAPPFPAAVAAEIPTSKPKSARPADLGPLPVLELDASAFDAVTMASETNLPAAGRVAGQP